MPFSARFTTRPLENPRFAGVGSRPWYNTLVPKIATSPSSAPCAKSARFVSHCHAAWSANHWRLAPSVNSTSTTSTKKAIAAFGVRSTRTRS